MGLRWPMPSKCPWAPAAWYVSENECLFGTEVDTQQAFKAWVWYAEKRGAVAAVHPRLVCCSQQGHASCFSGVPLLPFIIGML